MSISVTYKAKTNVPVEVEGIVPDVVRDKSIDEVRQLQIFHGNREVSLGEFFDVDGDPTDEVMHWYGDLSGVHWLGAKMGSGRIEVHGEGGRHIGSEMSGGEIHVRGNAGDWVGGEMQGGLIRVDGKAGHLVGAAYRGSQRGMTGGTILVKGDVGNELGHTMRRGLIAVGGNAGDLIGFNMLAGTVLVFGSCGIRHGAGMRRGTIGLFGECDAGVLPSFRSGCEYDPPALDLIFRELARLDFPVNETVRTSQFKIYHGDLIEGGRGEIFVPV